MKKTSILILFIFLFSPLADYSAAKEIKIGYIDAERILNESQEYKDARRILDAEEKEYSRQARKMEKDIENLEDEIDAQSLMWSDEKKLEKQQQGQQMVLQYQQFLKEIWGSEGKLYQRNLELSKPIIDKINNIINKVGEEDGYDIVFDASAGNIVFAKPDFDLTDRIIEEMKKK